MQQKHIICMEVMHHSLPMLKHDCCLTYDIYYYIYESKLISYRVIFKYNKMN